MAPTGDSANKISCTKVHITPEKSVRFSGLRKRRYSHTLRITYYIKSNMTEFHEETHM